jgi:hypothetical protein
MSSNIILADNGITSTVAGIKETAGSDGTLIIQTTNAAGTATTALTINNNQQVTFANAIVPNNTTGIVGVTDGSNANAGVVGEYVSAQVSAPTTGATSGSALNATSISLTAGDWDVNGTIAFNFAAATGSNFQGSINTTSATFPGGQSVSQLNGSSTYLSTTLTTNTGVTLPVPPQRINITTTTTVYLIGVLTFTSGTAGIGGTIRARRIR